MRRPLAAAFLALAALLSAARLFAVELAIPGGILPVPGTGDNVSLRIPVTLTADTLSYDDAAGVAVAEGNVEVGLGNRTLRADRMRYDARTGDADLTGRVHYKDAGDEFSFDRITLNIDSELGVLYNGSIRLSTNNYLIASDRFEKTGKKSFLIQKGSLTTCPCDPVPDWRFEVRRSTVTLDGYAVGKDVTFRVRGMPVLWLPWAAFPVKLSRQSGLLFPAFSHGQSKGYSLQLPYYWAINRWSDATLTLEAMSARGYRPEAEYRYVLNRTSEGAIRATSFHDRTTGDERARFYGENVFLAGQSWTANGKWDVASDDAYYVDLVDDETLRTSRHVPSRAFTGFTGTRQYHAVAVDWIQDIQGTPDDNTVQRLPEYTAAFLPRPIGRTGIDVAGEGAVTWFFRRAGNREVRGRGSAEVYRPFRLHSSVILTPYLSVDLLSAVPTSDDGGRENAGRVVPWGGALLGADLHKDFEWAKGARAVHTLRPAVEFRHVPRADQGRIPIRDLWDRLDAQSQMIFSLDQRILRIGERGPAEILSFDLEWAFDLGGRVAAESPYVDPLSPFVRSLRDQIDLVNAQSGRQTDSASDIYARLRLTPAETWTFSGESLFDPVGGRFTTVAAGGEWKKDAQNRARLEYRASRGLAEDIHGLVAYRLLRILGVQVQADYSIRNQELTEGATTLTLYPRSDCWSLGLVVNRRTRPEETGYKVVFSLKGIGGIGN